MTVSLFRPNVSLTLGRLLYRISTMGLQGCAAAKAVHKEYSHSMALSTIRVAPANQDVVMEGETS